jgi:hypothetical protein
MHIEISTDSNITGSDGLTAHTKETVRKTLAHFAGSLFGAVDADNPEMLPASLAEGNWELYRTIDESEFGHSREARIAIIPIPTRPAKRDRSGVV